MAETSIEWCDYTFNPWRGCTKVSPGCENCYAETMSKRNPSVLGEWGPQGARVVAAESYWKQPILWNKRAQCYGPGKSCPGECYWCANGRERPRVFCASLADVFEGPETMPAESWQIIRAARIRLLRLIVATPNLDWLILTKRPENVTPMLSDIGSCVDTYDAEAMSKAWHSRVWLGTSVEDQQRADERIPHLLATAAAIRFISAEPLLGPVNLSQWLDTGADYYGQREWKPQLDWVIVGGESGHGARPLNIEWVRSIVAQCKSAGTACFVKQLGARAIDPATLGLALISNNRHGKSFLRDRKGGDMSEWPEDLRVREFPEVEPGPMPTKPPTCPKCGSRCWQKFKSYAMYDCDSKQLDKGTFKQSVDCRIREVESQLSTANARLATMEAALKFYANEDLYKLTSYEGDSEAHADRGEVARAAIQPATVPSVSANA